MGLIRLLLASLVVAAHSGGNINPNFSGPTAVVLFYIASGFYMAMVLNTKYQGAGAAKRFYASRYTRLWVPYIVVVALVLLDRFLSADYGWLQALQTAPWWLATLAVLANLLIVGQDLFWLIAFDAQGIRWAPQLMSEAHNGTQLLLNLPMFTVAIELYFYLLAPWVLVRFERALAFAAVSAVWVAAITLTKQANITTMYYLFPAAMFYFGLGAVVWWVSQCKEALRGWRYFGVVGLLLIALWAKQIAPSTLVVLFCLAVPTAFQLTRHSRLDRMLGDLSYPVYLVHWPIVHLMRPLFVGDEYAVYLASLLGSLAAAGLILLLIDRPLTRWRGRFATSPA